MEKVFR